MARQKQRIAGQHQHEQRHPLGTCRVAQALRQLCTEVELQGLALQALHGRAGEIGGHLEQRVLIAQLLAPMLQLALALAGFQPAALPHGVVGVLQGQCRQALGTGLIALHELAHHHVHRPAIGDDMVHAHHQYVLVGAEPEQAGAQQRAIEQVEWAGDVGVHLARQFGLVALGQVDAAQGQGRSGQHPLLGLLAIELKHRA